MSVSAVRKIQDFLFVVSRQVCKTREITNLYQDRLAEIKSGLYSNKQGLHVVSGVREGAEGILGVVKGSFVPVTKVFSHIVEGIGGTRNDASIQLIGRKELNVDSLLESYRRSLSLFDTLYQTVSQTNNH